MIVAICHGIHIKCLISKSSDEKLAIRGKYHVPIIFTEDQSVVGGGEGNEIGFEYEYGADDDLKIHFLFTDCLF